jgi:O-antigen ligase
MAGPGLLLLVAWWLRGDPRRVGWFLVAALAGLLTEFALFAVGNPQVLLDRPRVELGFTELASALYGGAALLGVLVFMPRAWHGAADPARPGRRLVLRAALVALVLALVQVQLITQSRAVWLMLAVLVPIVLIAGFRLERRRSNAALAHRWRLYGGFLAAIGLVLVLSADTLQDNLARGQSELRQMVVTDFEDIPNSSIGYRVMLNRFGMELVERRPWVGWGPGTDSTGVLVQRFDRPQLDDRGDLHNLYLEIPVRVGAVGAALYLTILALLLHSGWRGYRAGIVSPRLCLFLAATLALTAGWCLINERLTNADFRIFLALLFAVMHTFGRRAAASEAIDHLAGKPLWTGPPVRAGKRLPG